MRVVTVVGARPQFIKSLPVSKAFREAGIEEMLLHTGQHYDHLLSEVFFDQLNIVQPARNLNIGSGSHAQQTSKALIGVEEFLQESKPDAIVLFGDTNSTLAGAIAASKLGVPIAHVESGLRSFDRRMPEEINREVTDKLSHWLFTPTQAARDNLLLEGAKPDRVFDVGDVMYDTFINFASNTPPLSKVVPLSPGYLLATIHRAENTDVPRRLIRIIQAFKEISRQLPVVFPVHPRTARMISQFGLNFDGCPGLHVVPPQGYLEMLCLLRNAGVVATDSGGLQKESYFAEKPCVVLRDNTEWVELLEADWNLLLSPDSEQDLVSQILSMQGHRGRLVDLYGGGRAAKRIAEILAASP